MYVSYWLFIYIISFFLFQTSDWKRILFTATAYCCCSHRKRQQEIIFICCITTVIWLRHDIVLVNLFNIINCSPEHNIYRVFSITAKNVSIFLSWSETCCYDLNDIILRYTKSCCMSLTCHYLHYFSFYFSIMIIK